MATITLEEALAQHGGPDGLAQRLGVSRQAIWLWKKQGALPEIWQYRLTTPGATWKPRKPRVKRDPLAGIVAPPVE
jgi:hypothetical protein